MKAAGYVAIRDDGGIKSLSINEREFLRSCALASTKGKESLRLDGRNQNDVRKVKVNLGRWDNGAECTIQWGSGTRVTSSIAGELVPPNPDRPSEGMVDFSVDISPMASSSVRLAPPVSTAPSGGSGGKRGTRNFSDRDQRLQSNRMLRCLERIILTGGALDREALVVIPGQWVWRLSINITVLDDGGNILDASVLAAVASLRHYRRPEVDLTRQTDDAVNGDSLENSQPRVLPRLVSSIVKEATPLPLHHTPLSISFALIPEQDAFHTTSTTAVATLLDPSDREELVQAGCLTVAMNIHSEVCLLDYGGGCELTPDKLKECWGIAESSIKQLCQLLEDTLYKADGKAQAELLERLQKQQSSDVDLLKKSVLNGGEDETSKPSYVSQADETAEIMDVGDTSTTDAQQIQQAELKAEAEYRRQALDFTAGHVAQKVREDSDVSGRNKAASSLKAGSLLASLLKTAKSSSNTDAPEVTSMKVEEGKSQKGAKKSTKPKPMDLDSDDEEEEETTTVLKSEFDTA